MSKESPAFAYYARKIQITNRSKLIAEWQDAPITLRDRAFLHDILDGFSLKELASKYNMTISGVAKRKHKLFIRLHRYDMRNL